MHNAVIRVYDEAGNVLETHEHAGDFKEPWAFSINNAIPKTRMILLVALPHRPVRAAGRESGVSDTVLMT